jgi:hypothetical protein
MSFQFTPFTANGSSVLPPRNLMSAGQFLQSPNKRFRLVYQPDENLRYTMANQSYGSQTQVMRT